MWNMPLVKTHIMLEPGQYALLKQESARSGLSMGEIVRRSVDAMLRPHARPRFAGFELDVAFWRKPDAALVARRIRPY
jgi:hypothetical protein